MSKKPNCHECLYRGYVPGNAHSSCKHPSVAGAAGDPLLNIAAIFAGVGRGSPIQAENDLNVKGDPLGIRNGWFNWPWNFDPVWLKRCKGYTTKQEEPTGA